MVLQECPLSLFGLILQCVVLYYASLNSLVNISCFGAHLILLINGKHVKYLSVVEQVANVFQEAFLLYLDVCEEEYSMGTPFCAPVEDLLQVLMPLH